MGIESEMKKLQLARCAKNSAKKKRKPTTHTKDANRRFLKEIVKNFLRRDISEARYDFTEIWKLLHQTQVAMRDDPTLLEIESPTFVCGDIHGQITDLRRIFHICGFPSRKRYLFLGDYVDRGAHAVEVICVLCALKLLFPHNVFLLRGNHELAHINKEYGFPDEIQGKFMDPAEAERIYNKFNEMFSYFPLAAVISGKILCMHGGLSPKLASLDDLRRIRRPIVRPAGLAQDLLWADPGHGIVGFAPNALRCCSVNFGEDEVKNKLKALGCSKMIRAHQVVQKGWEVFAGGAVITVFSASRYQEELNNYGAVVDIKKNLGIGFMMIKPADFDEKVGAQETLTAERSGKKSAEATQSPESKEAAAVAKPASPASAAAAAREEAAPTTARATPIAAAAAITSKKEGGVSPAAAAASRKDSLIATTPVVSARRGEGRSRSASPETAQAASQRGGSAELVAVLKIPSEEEEEAVPSLMTPSTSDGSEVDARPSDNREE